METDFPDFIRALPRPDADVALDAYLSSGDRGLVMFYEAPDEDVFVPEHVHGDQWGIVLQGTVRIQIGDEMHECHRGDTYFVPGGVPHITWVEAGTRGLDIFEEHDRYLPRKD
ncbi:MAG: cupin domain-containing protein [Actinobacteria bacterium]|jgi:mannose-6-phosphate isomerase-like protein (cupin superfamily)|nr:cupin domain-containing protein [Actinomycetota bacterium]